MGSIVAIKSATGNYFEIGRDQEEYYLKNEYTEIPNEFHKYAMADVKKLFDDLCARVQNARRWNT